MHVFVVYECAGCRTAERSRKCHCNNTQAKVRLYDTDTRPEGGSDRRGGGQESVAETPSETGDRVCKRKVQDNERMGEFSICGLRICPDCVRKELPFMFVDDFRLALSRQCMQNLDQDIKLICVSTNALLRARA